jgi:hypothetical protein
MAVAKSALDFTFDDEELEFQEEAAKGPTPVPLGWYNIAITDISVDSYPPEHEKYGGEHPKGFIVLTVKLIDGDFKGREIRFVRVPLFPRWAPGPKSPDGTATSFMAFFKSLGLISNNKLVLKDWNQLFGKELQAKIVTTKPNDSGAVYNQIQPFASSWKPKATDTDDDDSGAGDITFGEAKEGFDLS